MDGKRPTKDEPPGKGPRAKRNTWTKPRTATNMKEEGGKKRQTIGNKDNNNTKKIQKAKDQGGQGGQGGQGNQRHNRSLRGKKR
jgi:hypothetical protein